MYRSPKICDFRQTKETTKAMDTRGLTTVFTFSTAPASWVVSSSFSISSNLLLAVFWAFLVFFNECFPLKKKKFYCMSLVSARVTEGSFDTKN